MNTVINLLYNDTWCHAGAHHMDWKKYRQDKPRILRELLIYLSEHPDSRDGIDGIVRWWSRDGKESKYDNTLVKDALQDLIIRKFVRIKQVDTVIYYGINPDRKNEIADFVAEGKKHF